MTYAPNIGMNGGRRQAVQGKYNAETGEQEPQKNIALKKAAERLGRDLSTARVDFCAEMQRINHTINDLRAERHTHLKDNKLLRRQQQRLCSRIMAMKDRDRRSSKRGRIISLMRKGAYTVQARAIARYLVKTGTAESHVGQAIKHLGGMLGLEVNKIMSRRTVQRAMLEEGVASDLQLGFEMVKSNGTILVFIAVNISNEKSQI